MEPWLEKLEGGRVFRVDVTLRVEGVVHDRKDRGGGFAWRSEVLELRHVE